MRLLFLNQYFYPDEAATSQILADLVEASRQRGFDCSVVASNRSYANPDVIYPKHEEWQGAVIERVPMTGFGRRSRLGRMTDYLTFLVGAGLAAFRAESDVMTGLSTPPILGALSTLVARVKGRKAVYWAMDVYPDLAFELGVLSPSGVTGRLLSLLSRWTLRSADLVIALGETMAKRLEAGGSKNVLTVHNWASEEGICPMLPGQSGLRTREGWNDKFVVLYSGNLGLAHEFETILLAAREMLGERDVHFAFAGGGPRRAEVEARARALEVTNISFHASVSRDDLGDLLGAGDLHLVTLAPGLAGLLVPSKTYGILAAGRPILYIGPAEGEVHDIVTKFGCGDSLRNGDVEGVCTAIRRTRDRDLWFRRGQLSREAFEQNFTKESQTSKILEALLKLKQS